MRLICSTAVNSCTLTKVNYRETNLYQFASLQFNYFVSEHELTAVEHNIMSLIGDIMPGAIN